MRMTLSTRNVDAVVANFYRADREATRAIKQANIDAGERVFVRAYDLAPKDTYFMVEHLHLRFTENKQGFEVGYEEADFVAAGLAFYPIYVEFGTVKMAAQPHLFPAWFEEQQRYANELSSHIHDAIERRAA